MRLTTLKRIIVSCLVLPMMCIQRVDADAIPVVNHSFEFPVIDPVENPFYAIPFVPLWIEIDIDADPDYPSKFVGIFLNPPADSPNGDHIVNANGNQLAFLYSGSGNALLQDLDAVYTAGKRYRLDVDVCPSKRYPPAGVNPDNTLALEFYYLDNAFERHTIRTTSVPAWDLTQNFLKTYSLTLPPVKDTDAWVNKTIGIALRAEGNTGGFWDLDNVRVTAFPKTPELTGDGRVNLADFAVLSRQLFSCSPQVSDLSGDGCVTYEDVFILAEHWLAEIP